MRTSRQFFSLGEIEYVDLHREPGTGKSKGFCFIQYKHADDAKKAKEQMNGFDFAGRAIRVGNVNAKGTGGGGQNSTNGTGPNSEAEVTCPSSHPLLTMARRRSEPRATCCLDGEACPQQRAFSFRF